MSEPTDSPKQDEGKLLPSSNKDVTTSGSNKDVSATTSGSGSTHLLENTKQQPTTPTSVNTR